MEEDELMERAGLKDIVATETIIERDNPIEIDGEDFLIDEGKMVENVGFILRFEREKNYRSDMGKIRLKEEDTYCIARVDSITYALKIPKKFTREDICNRLIEARKSYENNRKRI